MDGAGVVAFRVVSIEETVHRLELTWYKGIEHKSQPDFRLDWYCSREAPGVSPLDKLCNVRVSFGPYLPIYHLSYLERGYDAPVEDKYCLLDWNCLSRLADIPNTHVTAIHSVSP